MDRQLEPIKKYEPDQFFTADQHARMKDLMSRRAALSDAERAELEELVDLELDATVTRTNKLLQ